MDIDLIDSNSTVGTEISASLRSKRYDDFKMAVAFSKNSGVGRIYDDLEFFKNNGGNFEAVIGIDQKITSYQALINLSNFAQNKLFIHHDRGYLNFHPKLYFFSSERNLKRIIIGSSNLTGGGLYTNIEANALIDIDQPGELGKLDTNLKLYWNRLLSDSNTKSANKSFIDNLFKLGLLSDETQQTSFQKIINKISKVPFTARQSKKAPAISKSINKAPFTLKKHYIMTLSNFDVSAKSLDPIILIPITALNMQPSFWNWPYSYRLSGGGYPEFHPHAKVNINGKITKQFIRTYYYDRKSEFRLQCEPVKRNASGGDLIDIAYDSNFPSEYIITLIKSSTPAYTRLAAKLTNRVSSQKMFGYY